MIKIIKKSWLETDDGKIFNIGDDIAFSILHKDDKKDHIMGTIIDYNYNTIKLNNIVLNNMPIDGSNFYVLTDMIDIQYVYYD